jgi:thiamine thiazole synthase
MQLNEKTITEAIVTRFYDKFRSAFELDVAIVGAGPSGLTAAYKLASEGFNVAIFERKLSIGGGMWGGGMTYNIIVVQEQGKRILEEMGLNPEPYSEGYYTLDAVEATTTLASKACQAGAKVFTCMSVEDVVIREEKEQKRVNGLVINSSPVEIAGLHVDPLVLHSRFVVEATGHDTEMLKTLVRKNGITLKTPSGGIQGEQSMWADLAENSTVDNTQEVFPGVYVCGMAANACFGSYRMGAIFGGMLLSGEKVAEDIARQLRQKDTA